LHLHQPQFGCGEFVKRIVKNIGFVIIALNAHFSNAQEQDIFSANMFPVGIYNTYSDFKNNKPTNDSEFYVEAINGKRYFLVGKNLYNQIIDQDSVQLVYKLRNTKGRQENRVYAFSDGNYLYINSALYQNHSNYFLKVLEVGRIILFKDPIMNKAQGVTTGALVGGLVGAAIGGSLASSKNGVIIFYQDDGVPYQLSEKTLRGILKENDQELYKMFMEVPKSNRDIALERFVIDFNNRHR